MQVHSELELEVPVEHGLLLENLLDLAHAPFTHTSTFAKGWPIPDVVKFNAARMLGGNWEPYPIDMSFEPPCMVLSTIGEVSLWLCCGFWSLTLYVDTSDWMSLLMWCQLW